ncbi:hypothetical protein [Actinokineospora sp. HUAS TT18]|uniref:hypothetical protein n=1 Tax=Actinokineospora sp. HUAS TT18 TaxID=3447451 RepID=UPI003F5204F6
MRSTFATVPFYRARWALDGRTAPVLVPGRTGGRAEGASAASVARGHLVDLVPLAGGAAELDPTRGLGAALTFSIGLSPGDIVALLDADAPHPPADLPAGVRGCLLRADDLGGTATTELADAIRRGQRVVAVGSDKELALLGAALPDGVAPLLTRVPHRAADQLDGGPFGVLHDATLGYLGALAGCGRWHLDERSVHVRPTQSGLAFTLLRQHSPRLVDILVPGSDRVDVGRCPRHGTPVLVAAEARGADQ